jgi:hypothetical protein
MAKLHTRQKRKLRMYGCLNGIKKDRVKRSKSFKTTDAAQAYAKSNGITNYTLVDLKAASEKNNKIKIVEL